MVHDWNIGLQMTAWAMVLFRRIARLVKGSDLWLAQEVEAKSWWSRVRSSAQDRSSLPNETYVKPTMYTYLSATYHNVPTDAHTVEAI